MAHDVFISHASADRPVAERLCGALEAEGLRCWMAPRDIPAGADWSSSIVDAIRQSRALILILSGAANTSIQIPRELERAVNARVPIVPLRVEDVLPAGALEYSLATVHWIDAFDGPIESRARALVDRIDALRARSESETAEAETRRAAAATQKAVQRRSRLRRAAMASAAAAIAATVVTVPLWHVAPFRTVDDRLLDWRMSLASPVAPNDGIVLVLIDEASVAGNPELLTTDIDALGRTISRIAGAGARAIAIDLLLSERWSRSVPFVELVLQHHQKLTLAARADGAGDIQGPEAASGLIAAVLGPPAAGRLFAFVNFPDDPEGRPRRLPRGFIDSSGSYRPSLAEHAVERFTGRPSQADAATFIDFRVDAGRLRRVSWKDVGMLIESGESIFRDRLVIVGAEYEGTRDLHAVPSTERMVRTVPGVVVQALAADTILAGQPVRGSAIGASMTIAFAVAFLAAFAAAVSRSTIGAGAAVAGAAILMPAIAAALFVLTQSVLPAAGPVAGAALAVALATSLGKRLPV